MGSLLEQETGYTVNLVKPNLVKPNISLYRTFFLERFRSYKNYLNKPKIYIKIYLNR